MNNISYFISCRNSLRINASNRYNTFLTSTVDTRRQMSSDWTGVEQNNGFRLNARELTLYSANFLFLTDHGNGYAIGYL